MALNLVGRAVSADQSKDSNIGSAQTGQDASASSVISTLVPILLVAVIWLIAFLILRRIFPRRYSPRSYLTSLNEHERSPQLPSGLFNWFGAFFNISDSYVLSHHSLDGYLLLRFLKMAVVTCIVGCVITWPVLFPVNITGGGTAKQFNLLTMANVKADGNNGFRYFAHAGCAWLFFGFIIYMITRESIFYISLRQAWLMSPLYAERVSSKTVLFTSVPAEYLDEQRLRGLLGPHVRHIWIPTDTTDLEELVKERDKVAFKLEGAETKLCKLAHNARTKALKGGDGGNEEEQVGIAHDSESGAVASRWLTPKQRPTHKLKPLIGEKVDTINWARAELRKLIPRVEKEQAKHRLFDGERIGSVFVEFDSLVEAQAAFQSLTHHQALHMSPRYTGLTPDEVIWSNLKIKWWARIVRYAGATAFVVALVIFWSIPVAIVGSISNIKSLMQTSGLGWLSFLNSLPPAIFGVVQGLLPVILLAVLMALLPIILRMMAKMAGAPTLSAVELTTQNYYFAFQVIQVFLVATLGSAASAVIDQIKTDPSSAPSILAQNLPKASTFYLSYFILQGLGVVAGMLVGLAGLIISKILAWLLDSTPRKMYKRWASLAGLGWGTVFPVYTNLFVIAICYACIAPLVMGFAAIGLWLFWFAYRYNLLFVYNINVDTKGLVYPRALQQVFTGLYIAEVCLAGLFGIACGSTVGAVGPLIMMILLIIFTSLYHISLNEALDPLLKYLPKSLEAEERRLLDLEFSGGHDHDSPDGRNSDPKAASSSAAAHLGPAPHPKPNMVTKFLKPWIYQDYETMRRLVPRELEIGYEPQVERDAYYHPAITSETPLLWIPRDDAGVSRQEVRDTGKVIPITDEGASFNEKGRIVWDEEGGVAPIAQEKVYY